MVWGAPGTAPRLRIWLETVLEAVPMSTEIEIIPLHESHHDSIMELSLAAWTSVFSSMRNEVPDYVFNAFYPHGWQARQLADIKAYLGQHPDLVWVALAEGKVAGWIGGKIHNEDRMGEIYILAVAPDFQLRGIARKLMNHILEFMRDQNLAMVMVETGDDSGHSASRSTYESAGFERWPVARYFRKI
jgi:GNAT superfamily N-acetyltransferase